VGVWVAVRVAVALGLAVLVAVTVAVRVGSEVGTAVGDVDEQVGQGSHAANVISRAAAAHPAASAAMIARAIQLARGWSYCSRQVMASALFSSLPIMRTSPSASSIIKALAHGLPTPNT
jgi:hypothetical protein